MRFFGTFILTFFAALFVTSSIAAQGKVTGTVTDKDLGDPIIGATVVLKGTPTGTTTDIDGRYTISVPVGQQTLVFSYIGYDSQELPVTVANGETFTLDVSISENAKALDEVVVVGYGVQRKRDLVGAVSKVEEVNDITGGSFQNALQGKATGVQVTQTSGVAGGGAIVRIRGNGSLSSAGDPLYVIDGIPIVNNNFQLGENGAQNVNPLNSINPNDIESVEVLKDASAAAIYGSRGANGVILITTKRGKKGKPKFTYNARVGVAKETNRVDMLNAEEWLAVRQEAWENDGNAGRVPLPNGLTYEDIEGINTNWVDQVTQTGLKHEHNISMRQGNSWLSTYVGLGYSDGESYLRNNRFQRMSGRLNVDITPTRNLKISINSSISRGVTFRVPVAWSGGLGLAQSTALPIYPVTFDPLIANAYERGDTARAQHWEGLASQSANFFNIGGNPLAQVDLIKFRIREWRTVNNAVISYTPVEGLTLTGQGNFEYQNLGEFSVEDSVWNNNQDISRGYYQHSINWSAYATAEYDFKKFIPEDHHFKIMGGAEFQQTRQLRDLYVEWFNVYDFLYGNPDYDAPGVIRNYVDSFNRTPTDPIIAQERFLSYFGRANYSYKDKYLLQVTVRADQSSRFAKNRRLGVFPAVGVGYVLSEENFLKDSKAINFLKLKASWGLRGIAGIPTQEQYASYTNVPGQFGYNDQPEIYQNKLENPNLGWETIRTFDAGVEFGFLDDRISGEITYYNSVTLDAVVKTRIQASTGIDAQDFYQNVGKIRNTGIEVGINTRNITGKFNWNTSLNFSHNSNVVVAVGTATPDALDGGFGDIRAVPGEPMGTNYIVRWAGIDPATGRPRYLTANGDTTSIYDVSLNRVSAGNVFPLFTGAITNTFKWKGFDLSFMLYYSYGAKIYDDAAKRQRGVVSDWNMTRDILDRWREPGDIAMYPQLTMTMLNWGGNDNIWQNNHSFWLYKADYIRLRNLTFGYTIPVKGKAITSARVFFSGTNLLTLTNYKGWDPEVARDRQNEQQRNIGGSNITYLTPPQEMSFVFGVDFDF